MTAAGFYSAFYLQGARGYSALEAGFASSPAALGAIVGARSASAWFAAGRYASPPQQR